MKLFSVLLLALAFGARAGNECAQDAKKYCAGIEPGKNQLAKCLDDYKDSLSPICAKELKEFKQKTAAKNPCFEDLAEFCVDVPSDPRKLEFCLLKHENRLSMTCAADFKKKKSDLIVRDVCAQDVVNTCYGAVSGPDGGLNKCLFKNKAKVSKFCQNRLDKQMAEMRKKNPCFDDTEKNCPSQITFLEIQECLEKKLPALAPECKKLVEAEKAHAAANPCYKDLRKHCKPGISAGDQHRCLVLNDKDLTPACKAYRTKEDEKVKKMVTLCEPDRVKLCPKAPFQNGQVIKCLRQNKAKLNKACAELI